MLEAEDILDGLVRGALGGSGKACERAGHAVRHAGLINARTLLAAAGVAWGLYETWQSQQAPAAAAPYGSAPAGGPRAAGPLAAPPPRPGAIPPSDEGGLPRPVLQLLRLMISAARADGDLGPAERARILAEAREVGAEALVLRELDSPRPLAEIVAGVTDPQLKEQLYTLAFTIVRADEAVTGSERIYLAQLAHRLGLDPTAVAHLEAEAARHIDAAGAPSPPIG